MRDSQNTLNGQILLLRQGFIFKDTDKPLIPV